MRATPSRLVEISIRYCIAVTIANPLPKSTRLVEQRKMTGECSDEVTNEPSQQPGAAPNFARSAPDSRQGPGPKIAAPRSHERRPGTTFPQVQRTRANRRLRARTK